jgi:hypothetical protein
MLAGNLAKDIKGQAFGQQTLANMPQIPVTFAKYIEAIWLGKMATTDGARLDLRAVAWLPHPKSPQIARSLDLNG